MKKQIFDKLRFIFLILVISCIQVVTFLNAMGKSNLKILSFAIYILGAISFIIYICYKLIYKKKYNLYDVLIMLLTIFAIISTVFAFNRNVALWGAPSRYEGLFSILSYYSFFLLATTIDKKHHHIIMYFIVAWGILQVAIGTIQVLQIDTILGYDRSHNWSTQFTSALGTLSNPNFYCTYVLMCGLWALGNLLKANTIIQKIIYSLLVSIFIYGLIIGNTTSSILVFVFVATLAICFNIKLKKIKQNLLPILVCLTLAPMVLYLINDYTNNRLYVKLKRIVDYDIVAIIKGGLDDSTGQYRIYVWKETLKEVPKHLLTGIGLDNFRYIKNGGPISVVTEYKTRRFDKAHNDYLQILSTEGIFTLIFYMMLVLNVLNIALTTDIKHKEYGIVLSFVGYLLQMLMVFSFISVAPVFYMIMGFVVNTKLVKE